MSKTTLFVGLLALLIVGSTPSMNVPALELSNTIMLTEGGFITVTVTADIENQCSGDVGLYRPLSHYGGIFEDYNNKQGETKTIGPFDAGTELIFFMRTYSPCPQREWRSTDSNQAIVTPLAVPNAWRIEWEDLPTNHSQRDDDFNDLILIVRLKGGEVPGFKQDDPRWKSDPYAISPGNVIGELGAGMTSAANLLMFHNTVEVTPGALNECLKREDIKGFFNGFSRWSKVSACSDPANQQMNPNSPPPMVFNQKVHAGDWFRDPATGNLIQGVTQAMLFDWIKTDLDQDKPVLLELQHPQVANGVHYVVVTKEDGGTYSINDPWCGEPFTSCPENKGTLSGYGNDNLRGIVRMGPGPFRHTLVINATFSGDSPLEFVVTDPQGRRTGYALGPEQRFADIPGANYYHQPSLVNQVTKQLQGNNMQEFYMVFPLESGPVAGTYFIDVYGKAEGHFTLTADYHFMAQRSTLDSIEGDSRSGEQQRYYLYVSPGNSAVWVKPLFIPIITK
jgi:hypothetical protein